MRSEQELLDLILTTAKSDDRIRAVILSGLRTNPNAPRDIFQDFEILYLVTHVAPFIDDHTWIQRFGELMIVQMPEAMHDPPPQNDGSFVYLMLFTDGNRIDLTLFPLANLTALAIDSLSVLLLDKDNHFAPFPPPSDSDYLPKMPTAQAFFDCCNEFWWVCPGVAKGLWREELPYAKHNFERFVREQLMKMLTWYVGSKTHFSHSPGKFGKYLKQYLEPELWEMLEQTYSDADTEHA
jgi:aminoglycoside 6-adenylyltransferase